MEKTTVHSEPQVTGIIVGNRGTDVPDSGTEPSSSGSSTTSKLQRYYKKFSELQAGNKYKFFNRDLMDTSIINYFPFNSYVGTVNKFDTEQKLDKDLRSLHYISNQVKKWSGVDDRFTGYIISGKLAKNHLAEFSIADDTINDTINDDDIYAYGEYTKNAGKKYRLLFRVYGIRPLTSQIYSAFNGAFTTRKTGGKRKRRTHRRRRSNRRRRS